MILYKTPKIYPGTKLNKIAKLEFFNSPKKSKKIQLDLNTKKQFFILTGFNGSGKSRMIKIIHEAFTVLRNSKYSSPISDWAFQCTLTDEVRVRGLKMRQGSATKEEINDLFDDFFANDLDLETVYNKGSSLVNREARAKFSTSANSDNEEVDHFSGSGCLMTPEFASKNSPDSYSQSLKMVAYIDEEIHYNAPDKVVNSVIKGKQPDLTLDKTLASLIYDFVVDRAYADDFKNKVAAIIGATESNKGISKEKIRQAVNTAMQELDTQKNFEVNPVFDELNNFFSMTNRKLVWLNNTIYMDVIDEGIFSFVEFSKGEKTLLALMLAVYLNRENSYFLMDEPDLSLHVEWQEQLLPAFQRLAPQTQFIIATHSPFLIMQTQSEQVFNLAKIFKEQAA